MSFIHDFWVQMFPMFINYGFVYLFLDLVSLLVLICAVVILPGRILLGGSKKLWND